jgi:hypothetical protein
MLRVDGKGFIAAMEATAAVVCDICGLRLAKADAASAAHPLVNRSKLARHDPKRTSPLVIHLVGVEAKLLARRPSQRLIDPVLPARAGFLEVLKHVLIYAQ